MIVGSVSLCKVKKNIIILLISFFVQLSFAQEVEFDDLLLRKGVFYEPFSNTPYSGSVVGRYKSGNIKEEGECINGVKSGNWTVFEDNSNNYRKIIVKEVYKEGKKQGERITYFRNCGYSKRLCAKETTSFYVNDQLHGPWISFNPNGTVSESGDYYLGTKNNLWEVFNSSGYLIEKRSYQLGSKHGTWYFYDSSGQLTESKIFNNNEPEGLQENYYPSGEIKEKRIILGGSLTSHQTFDKEGGIINDLKYKGGKKNGQELIFYKNGQLKSQGEWKNGSKNGTWEYYDLSGNMNKKETYSNENLQEKVDYYYFSSGQLKEKRVYKNNSSNGVGTEYFIDGRIKKIKTYVNGSIKDETAYVYNDDSGERFIVKGKNINGKKEGQWEYFNENDELISKGSYENDKREGLWEFYYEEREIKYIERTNLEWEQRITMWQSKTKEPAATKSLTNGETINAGATIAIDGVDIEQGDFITQYLPPDSEYLPIVKVAPVYPSRAQSRGIEGYCIVEYIVTSTGTTKNPKIVECTSSLFQSASLKAALKFKYKPRVINGTPIDVSGVQTQITFELER